MWTREIAISDVDLCIIFSNLIENAVEALQVESEIEKYIVVQLRQGEQFSEIIIKNSYIQNESCMTSSSLSKKADSRNHGLGLENVKEVVKRNQGDFDINFHKEEVVATVIL